MGLFGKKEEQEPEDEKGYYKRGKAFAKNGEYDKAIEDYKKAIIFEDKRFATTADWLMGIAYQGKGDFSMSAKNYSEAVKNYELALAQFDKVIHHYEHGDTDSDTQGNANDSVKRKGAVKEKLKKAKNLLTVAGQTPPKKEEPPKPPEPAAAKSDTGGVEE